MKNEQKNLVFLDGDHFREIMGDELGHDIQDRVKNAYRIARMCHFLNSENVDVICATMSLYPEVWQWCRTHISKYIQVYVRVDKDVVVGRDQKGIYSGFLNGQRANVVGMDMPFHEPIDAELIVDNNGNDIRLIDNAVERILGFLRQKGEL